MKLRLRQLYMIAPCVSIILCAQPQRGCAADTPAPPVVLPHPTTLQITQTQPIALPQHIQLIWHGQKTPVLTAAVARFHTRLEMLSGTKISFSAAAQKTHNFALVISCPEKGDFFPSLGMNEAYSLKVSPARAEISAQSAAGILHGLTSLLQLVSQTSAGPVLQPATMTDAPRFRWRGLMLDVSRHFMSLSTIKRQIDAMEMVKLNVLHLHLSDGQGFRVESKLFPRLQSISSHGQYYTQDEVRALIHYAAERGIRIVPEFDTPGHSFALLEAYPLYAAQAPLNMTDRAERNRAALDPTKPETYEFISKLYGEMAALFPDAYFHIGGDEVVAKQWTESPAISAYIKQHKLNGPAELQAEFTTKAVDMLSKDHKTAIGWDEITAASIPQRTVVEVWRGAAHTAEATADGHPVILSERYYLDRLLPSAQHYQDDPLASPQSTSEAEAAARTSGPGGTITTQSKPTDTQPLSEAQKKLVLGGEAALWTEIVSEDMLDARLWPRLAAIAERFWSQPENCQPDTLSARLGVTQNRLETLGIQSDESTEKRITQLAPGKEKSVRILLSVTSPVRNYAHNHEFLQIRHKQTATEQQLNTLADIASPDSPQAESFNKRAAAFMDGQIELRDSLITDLQLWSGNNARFIKAAARYPALKDGLQASALLHDLAMAGLAALGDKRTLHWRNKGCAAVQTAKEQIAASENIKIVSKTQQPEGDLLQDITPGVETLMRCSE